MIGVADAHDRKTICSVEQETRLDRLLRILVGRSVARPLANPTLEALRELAMSAALGKGFWSGRGNSWEELQPPLLLAARLFLADRGFLDIKACSVVRFLGAMDGAGDRHTIPFGSVEKDTSMADRMSIAA